MNNKLSEIELLLNKPKQEQKELGYINTAQEIVSQPQRWLETLAIIEKHFEDLSTFVGKDPVLLLSGAGSSHYVSLSVHSYPLHGRATAPRGMPFQSLPKNYARGW